MPDFEDLTLADLLDKVDKKVEEIVQSRRISGFNDLGKSVQAVYDFFVTATKPYEEQQSYLKNIFTSFNYAAVIINDALQSDKMTEESATSLNECLEIIAMCCRKIKDSLGVN